MAPAAREKLVSMDPWLENFAKTAFERSADTAHDLKTPLNVAILNLELLRMRLRKLLGENEDEKIVKYAGAIDDELRRLARIFDAYFTNSTPPKAELETIDARSFFQEAASSAQVPIALPGEPAAVRGHEARIRELARLFIQGAAKLLLSSCRVEGTVDADRFQVVATGRPHAEFELSKLFKFYYTDPSGNPELSIATARLIAETYGGSLTGALSESGLSLELSLPLGDR